VEDTGVVSAIRIGEVGIFMPVKYDGTEKGEENGATLFWKDTCDYGFPDGERFTFLQTEQGLLYSEDTYISLSGTSTLDDIKSYVIKMINTP
jgi:hypothetical protein